MEGRLARNRPQQEGARRASCCCSSSSYSRSFPVRSHPTIRRPQIYDPALGPSWHHLLGTTGRGEDVFSQLVWGTRLSLVIALAVGALATALSVLIGVSSAYLGGIADGILSLITDVILVLPIFPLIIVIAAYRRNSGLLHAHRGARRARLVVRRSAAPFADAVAADARLPRVGARAGRAEALHHPVRDPADDDVADRGDVPRCRPLRRADRGGAAVHRARRPEQPELGDDALLGAERRGALCGHAAVGDCARRLHRAARRLLRAAQLRLRRDQQPGPAGAEARGERDSDAPALAREASAPSDASRSRTSPSPTRPTAGRSSPSTTSTSSSGAASSSPSSASRAAGSRRCSTRSRGCSARRSPGEIVGGRVLFQGKDLVLLEERELRRVRWRDLSVVMQSAMNALNPVLDSRRADARRLPRPLEHVEARDRGALARGATARLDRPGPPPQLSASALRRDAAARDDRDGAALHAGSRDHGRAHLGARRRRAAVADGADQGAAGAARLRRHLRDARHVAREPLLRHACS